MNLLKDLPNDLTREVFDDLLTHQQLRIERIVSKGQITPEDEWYDQEEHEWVLVLQGAGELTFAEGSVTHLKAGDHINIPAHTKHKVSWTDPNKETIWLAVFYQ
ncbi:cupin domain-containing protein [Vibrio alfacsensis]|uniref:cupin domain-containing protein n=1 Tax=Vibrio alfacsensis TaxID=1074311 RepID=UPI0040684857